MQNGSKPISVLIGPDTSASAVLVGSFLQVVDIPAISSIATSVDLSSKLHKNFFRTVPPDIWQAKVMADIIELFNWTYVAAVGLDDSYGRNGIWALEKESYNRKTFCVAFSEHIPRRDYHDKIMTWWEEFWRLEFNCSAIDLGRIPTCESNLTLHNALKKDSELFRVV